MLPRDVTLAVEQRMGGNSALPLSFCALLQSLPVLDVATSYILFSRSVVFL